MQLRGAAHTASTLSCQLIAFNDDGSQAVSRRLGLKWLLEARSVAHRLVQLASGPQMGKLGPHQCGGLAHFARDAAPERRWQVMISFLLNSVSHCSLMMQDPGVFWNAATLVDAFNVAKPPNATLAESGASFPDYYLLSRECFGTEW